VHICLYFATGGPNVLLLGACPMFQKNCWWAFQYGSFKKFKKSCERPHDLITMNHTMCPHSWTTNTKANDPDNSLYYQIPQRLGSIHLKDSCWSIKIQWCHWEKSQGLGGGGNMVQVEWWSRTATASFLAKEKTWKVSSCFWTDCNKFLALGFWVWTESSFYLKPPSSQQRRVSI